MQKHYDCDYEYDYDRENKVHASSLSLSFPARTKDQKTKATCSSLLTKHWLNRKKTRKITFKLQKHIHFRLRRNGMKKSFVGLEQARQCSGIESSHLVLIGSEALQAPFFEER